VPSAAYPFPFWQKYGSGLQGGYFVMECEYLIIYQQVVGISIALVKLPV
jgi:hypothetical protein